MQPGATTADFEAAIAQLKTADPKLAEIIEIVGPCRLTPTEDAYFALAESIIHQQLSMKAAGTIFRRFAALMPGKAFPDPEDVLAAREETLKAVGLSGQKIRYLRDLSAKFLDGTVDPSGFSSMSDEEIIAELTKIKGIGRWTAEMYLIFSLARPNVLPVDDLGLQKAIQRHYGLNDLPIIQRIREVAVRWQPFCTVATWYMWRSFECMPFDS
jgi:DNA-3-methyladenine glycosylase II